MAFRTIQKHSPVARSAFRALVKCGDWSQLPLGQKGNTVQGHIAKGPPKYCQQDIWGSHDGQFGQAGDHLGCGLARISAALVPPPQTMTPDAFFPCRDGPNEAVACDKGHKQTAQC